MRKTLNDEIVIFQFRKRLFNAMDAYGCARKIHKIEKRHMLGNYNIATQEFESDVRRVGNVE